MNIRPARTTLMLGALALLFAVSPALARSKSEVIGSLKARYPALKTATSSGFAGETWTGYPEAVSAANLGKKVTDRGKSITVQQLLKDETADRRELYQIIAKEQNTSAKLVAENNGKRKLKRLASGEYYKLQSGKWIRKR